ncbi:GNAT family N-acetyltransferase [Candidatus Spongiisocius sp.]|uniref:GNAT family N-acetyltransferase n=1 Tax=Candidatus Spongiisocius sp. TaxID=3101273 RepID=UPI003B5AD6B5
MTDDLRYVNLEARWAEELEALELRSFPSANPADLYSAGELVELAEVFPEGGFVVLDGETPIGMGLGVRVHFDLSRPQHRMKDLMSGHKAGHDPTGEWYYGTDIAVNPGYRRRGIGSRLYDLRKEVCRNLGLRGIIAGGVIPGYAEHKDRMSAAEYVEKVAAGELYDRTLSFQIENGFEARGVLENYIEDPEVDNWASLIVWETR